MGAVVPPLLAEPCTVAPVTTREKWMLIAATNAGCLLIASSNLVINVALPTLARDLHASSSELQWIVSSYLLVYASLLIVGGNLGDRYGRLRMFRIGLTLFAGASALGAWSTSATTLIASRGLMGIGAAMIMPSTLSILTNVFTNPQERARAIGTWSAMGGLGFALGPFLGGVLLSRFWWGSVFLVNVVIAFLTMAVGWRVIPESRNTTRSRFDPIGVVLSTLGTSALVYAVIHAPDAGWTAPITLGVFAASMATLAGFVLWELHCDHPMLELEFFKNPRYSMGNVVMLFGSMVWAGFIFVITQLLQFVYGYSAFEAGVAILPFAATFTVMALLGPHVVERIGTKRTVVLALGIYAVGLAMVTTVGRETTYFHVGFGMLIIGFGFGMLNPPLSEAVMGAVPREKAGLASGPNTMARQLGSAMGVATIGSLLASGYQSTLADRQAEIGIGAGALATAQTSLSEALRTARRLGGATGDALAETAKTAFLHGLRIALVTAIGMLLFGAFLALRSLPARASDEAHEAGDGAGAAVGRPAGLLAPVDALDALDV